MSREKKELPPEIRDDENYLDPDEAIAQALDALTGEKRIKVMSYLKSDGEAAKIALMFAMGRRRAFRFLTKIANDRLLLACSTDKGVRSRQLVEALHNLFGGGSEEKLGLTDRIKKAFKRDFVSSQ